MFPQQLCAASVVAADAPLAAAAIAQHLQLWRLLHASAGPAHRGSSLLIPAATGAAGEKGGMQQATHIFIY
jgi:hypothetical protein